MICANIASMAPTVIPVILHCFDMCKRVGHFCLLAAAKAVRAAAVHVLRCLAVSMVFAFLLVSLWFLPTLLLLLPLLHCWLHLMLLLERLGLERHLIDGWRWLASRKVHMLAHMRFIVSGFAFLSSSYFVAPNVLAQNCQLPCRILHHEMRLHSYQIPSGMLSSGC